MRPITIKCGWAGKLPRCGVACDVHARQDAAPQIPVRNVGIKLHPYKGEGGGRCTLPLLTECKMIRHFGTLRCMPATHIKGPALSRRNAHELPQCTAFNSEYRKRMKACGLDVRDFWVVSPACGEWLCGLPRNWTSHDTVLPRTARPPENRPTVFDTFTGCGGLTLATHPTMRAIAYCERDEACRRVLLQRMSEDNLDKAPIFTDIVELCEALENPSGNRQLFETASSILGGRGKPKFRVLQGARFCDGCLHFYDYDIDRNVGNVDKDGVKGDDMTFILRWLAVPGHRQRRLPPWRYRG